MYTIKSETADGVYYLCNHWNENNTFWMRHSDIRSDRLYKAPGLAKRSLKHLLKIMPEYWEDKFTVVAIDNEKKIRETEKITAVCVSYNKVCDHHGFPDITDVSLICDQADASET